MVHNSTTPIKMGPNNIIYNPTPSPGRIDVEPKQKLKLSQAKRQRRKPNTLHTDMSKLQHIKTTGSMEAARNHWS
jgi:hypothetical protein